MCTSGNSLRKYRFSTNFQKEDLDFYLTAINRYIKENNLDKDYFQIKREAFDASGDRMKNHYSLYVCNVIRDLTDFWKIFDEEKSHYVTRENCYLNMQYYYEYVKRHGYITPKEWIKNHKHF